jgi:hypothetical protein
MLIADKDVTSTYMKIIEEDMNNNRIKVKNIHEDGIIILKIVFINKFILK